MCELELPFMFDSHDFSEIRDDSLSGEMLCP